MQKFVVVVLVMLLVMVKNVSLFDELIDLFNRVMLVVVGGSCVDY